MRGEEEGMVMFDEGVGGVRGGEGVVFYDGEECVGGGRIEDVLKDGEKVWYV
ncbi:aminomethyltransferase beta-barrel domain-containing protein [Bacillus sp. WP8]|uniref:aminomethyltransferase beta-barrel domain-containing protein n=1 Tax=Bacillus sp. WP8 TaxID=756828 RepID=UPI0037C12193